MYNDFTGKELYKSHHQDLLKEAEGGWRIKAAGVDRPGLSMGKLVLVVTGVLLAALLIAQGFAG
jgi:hypothetical protein